MRKKTIIIPALIFFIAVWGFIIQRYAYSEDKNDSKKCENDSECFLAMNCAGCNQCFSNSPLEDDNDCKTECMPDQNLECKCIKGYCTSVQKSVSENNQIWVSKLFSGGAQCSDNLIPKPILTETAELLRKKNITFANIKEINLNVCEACGCPEYSLRHCFLIKKNDLEAAKTLGFNANSICGQN